MERFTGKTILVTGGASGIGAATVTRLLDEGANVVSLDRDVDVRTHERLRTAVGDVAAEADVADVVAWAVREFGRLDGTMHAAGVAGGGPIHLLDHHEWDRVIRINLTGTYLVSRYSILQFMAQEPVNGTRGSLVNVASVEGIEGTAGGSAYNASKGGVVLLTKNLAIDYGPQGIRVNALCPGFIDTPLMAAVTDMPGLEAFKADMIEEHALRRNGAPAEMAAVAAFLLSDDASFVTGHAMVADGGYTAGRDHGLTKLLGL